MKTSNRILLFTALFIITSYLSFQSLVYSKYVNKDFTYLKTETGTPLHHKNYEKTNLQNLKHIDIEGPYLQIKIVPSDSAQIEFVKQDSLIVQQIGDTLKVIATNSQQNADQKQMINIYAGKELLSIQNTGKSILINQQITKNKTVTMHQTWGSTLYLENFVNMNLRIKQTNSSELILRNNTFNFLHIVSNKAAIKLDHNTIDTLETQFTNSSTLSLSSSLVHHWKGGMMAEQSSSAPVLTP